MKLTSGTGETGASPSPRERGPGGEDKNTPGATPHCLLHLIHRCEQWLQAEARKLHIPAHDILGAWLFETKEEWLHRYRFKQQVLERLKKYYAKQLANEMISQ